MKLSAPQTALRVPNRPFKQLTYVQIEDVPCYAGPAIGYICVLDTGTTGTDIGADHITNLAWVILGVNAAHQICEVNGPFAYNGPWPSPDEPHALHADLQMFLTHLSRSNLVVAHNAAFDQAMLRNALPQLPPVENLPWACSMRDFDWHAHGVRDYRLKDLLEACGMCHNAHDTMEDAIALSWILSRTLPGSASGPAAASMPTTCATPKGNNTGGAVVDLKSTQPVQHPTILHHLISWTEAAKISFAVSAKNPSQRSALKRRGYRFNRDYGGYQQSSDGSRPVNGPRSFMQAREPRWCRLVPMGLADAEYGWLTAKGDVDLVLDAVFARSLFDKQDRNRPAIMHLPSAHTRH